MTILNFEKQLTRSQLHKGLDYFEAGTIVRIRKNGTAWNAVVRGSKPYNVKIVIKGNIIKLAYCSCPYDDLYCKHVVAVLYHIQNKRITKGRSPVPKKPAIIKKAGSEKYASRLQKAIDNICARYRYITDANISEFMDITKMLWGKASTAFKEGKYEKSIHICLALLTHVHHVATCVEIRYEEVWEYMDKPFKMHLKIAKIDSMVGKRKEILDGVSTKLAEATIETEEYAVNGRPKFYALMQIEEYEEKLSKLMEKL